jgi:kynurenine 3-monooxygenase
MSKVIISGAGLVGSFWALALVKRGFEVELFEKRSDMRKDSVDGGRSINLIATSRALNAFKSIGIDKEIKKICVPVTGRMMHSLEGELTYQPYGRDESECNYSVSRALLNITLLNQAEEAGVRIHFDKALTDLNPDEKTAIFNDTEKVNYQLFFGADGAGSPTRKALLKLIPDATESVSFIDSDYKELLMPAGEEGEYPIEKKALHIWPRGDHMLMALPNLNGSFTMTAYLPKKGERSFEKLKSKEDVSSFFEKYYKSSVAHMPKFADEFMENPQGVLGTVRMSHWAYKDQIALIGDAAHAIVPFFGQGMNCGMEDCTVLLSLMDKYNDDWSKIFKEYDQTQRPNGNAIADMALENFVEMKDKVGDEKFLLKKAIEHKIENSFPDMYRSRYGMVTYTLIPYSIAQKAGIIQQEILEELTSDTETVDNVDMNKAEMLINEKFMPFIKKNNVDISRYEEN